MSNWKKQLLGLGITTIVWLLISLLGGWSADGNLFGMVAFALFPFWLVASAITALMIWLISRRPN